MKALALARRLTRPQEENPLWLVVLCDLMTNLMLFFLVMYSFTLQNPKVRAQWLKAFEASQLIDRQADADEVVREFKEREAAGALVGLVKDSALRDSADIEVSERAIRVRLRDRILFPTAQAGLNDAAGRTLGRLAEVLRQIPNDVVVEGHTDDVPVVSGAYKTNWELSVARASSVISVLIKDGVPAPRLVAAGYGPYHPLGPNDGPAGRAANRRVEVVILRGAPSSQ